eukprot:TRINITY_DN4169_c2_g1_i1.p1 TRINITY_DN4169_c2_g1~~TRINITY_DN4169_c2_g1_i1.p1  ORF type:complete len:844 (+),score=161.06 TRINITY_DN4169_c2_g1_i1:68-2533(+)
MLEDPTISRRRGFSVNQEENILFDDDLDANDELTPLDVNRRTMSLMGSLKDGSAPISQKWASGAKYYYESLDFMEVENDLLQEDRTQKSKLPRKRFDYKRWCLLFLIGMLTGTTAFLIDKGIEQISKYKWKWVGEQMETSSGGGTVPFLSPFLTFSAMNLVLSVAAASLVVYVEPLAAGSGIPEVKCYLNGIRIYRVVRLRTLLAKATGILFSVASGLPCGKEGPMIHSGAIIGGGVATGKSSKLHFDTGFLKEYRGDADKRLFVTAGAAAGVAAAFGAPVGGVLFAVEEVGSFWNLDMSIQVFFCATFSSLAINMYSKFQDPLAPASGQTNFGVVNGDYKIWELPFHILLGAIGGIVGAVFNQLNIEITQVRRKYIKQNKTKRILEVILINLAVSTILFVLTSRLYDCESMTELYNNGTDSVTGDLYVRVYGCNETTEYNNMATLFFSQTEANIRHMFHQESHLDYVTMIMHFVPYFFLTVLTYGIAVPSGLFLPCLALGASVGRIYGQGLHDLFDFDVSYGSYACFGAAAVLSGVVRMTVSLSVILMEATGNNTYVIPLMLITCTAKLVGDLFNHGIYDMHIDLQKIPLLENHLQPGLETATAADVMNALDAPCLPYEPTVRSILQLLHDKPHHQAFIVTTEGKKSEALQGLILRRYLLILLRKGAWGVMARSLNYEDFVKSAHERVIMKPQKYALSLTSTDLSQKMDLSRYMDKYPVTVTKETPLPRVFKLVRDLGLRHLVVVTPNHQPCGIIGRKCLSHLYPLDPAAAECSPSHFLAERHPSVERLPTSLFITTERAGSAGSGFGELENSSFNLTQQ